jgi:hypothetical protein
VITPSVVFSPNPPRFVMNAPPTGAQCFGAASALLTNSTTHKHPALTTQLDFFSDIPHLLGDWGVKEQFEGEGEPGFTDVASHCCLEAGYSDFES